ncbi:hypothetical protein M7I_1881 [Glarea lozoyensis 74030]|uniref:Uncharacterized protein n=1 Tax=Glarea lozoyensis (strain ATCC 74030 / MF5533) TaxID=1104152 RepID=H0EHA4_GLAL7|nr:hypothetical protein M7I_1881 [Glarea lozoyensis 74030]
MVSINAIRGNISFPLLCSFDPLHYCFGYFKTVFFLLRRAISSLSHVRHVVFHDSKIVFQAWRFVWHRSGWTRNIAYPHRLYWHVFLI